MVGFIDHHDLESLLCTQVDLLCLGNLLEQILNDHSIIVSNIGRCNFEMVYRGYNVEFEFSIRCCLEYTCVNLDLLNTRSVELFECSDDTCLLSGAGWPVNEEMWKVTALRLRENVRFQLVKIGVHIQELVSDLKALGDS